MRGSRCFVLKTMWKRRLVKVFAIVVGDCAMSRCVSPLWGWGKLGFPHPGSARSTRGRRSFVALTPGYILLAPLGPTHSAHGLDQEVVPLERRPHPQTGALSSLPCPVGAQECSPESERRRSGDPG